MCDYFTKWPEARAIPQKTAKCVADFVHWTITRNGCPEIHHTGQCHLVTSTSIGGSLSVYDSLYSSLTKSIEVQLAQCYSGLINEKKILNVDVPSAQVQTGTVDCGLFAICTFACILFEFYFVSPNRIYRYFFFVCMLYLVICRIIKGGRNP